MITLLQVCATMYNGNSTNFADLANCGIGTLFGLDYVAFGFVALALVAGLAYLFRLDSKIALVFGFALVYMFDLLAGGNQMLQMAMLLLGIGIALAIGTGLMSNVKDYS